MKAFEIAQKEHLTVSTVIRSGKSSETYPWLGAVPKMGEWKDERIPQAMLEHNFTIANRDFEASIAVDRNAIEDEQYGQIEVRVKELATEAVRFFDELAFTLMGQGTQTSGSAGTIYDGVTLTAYDGKAFFATNHSEGDSGTQSNRGSSALSASALQSAITSMKKFKNDKGKPAHVRPNLLTVPNDLEWEAKELLNSQFYPEEGTTTNKMAVNVLKGSLNLLVNDYLTDTDNWFIFDTNRVVKPMILQLRQDPRFTSLVSGTESSFMRKKLYFGVDWRGEILWGDWRTGFVSIV
ncbi:MAG: Mu-like prophage major head subunit gpT family protein [Patescibacteria group bacterium]|nr:Mu-like prophage major head subunit gpT family protein [Patescibacteria group bacterium]